MGGKAGDGAATVVRCPGGSVVGHLWQGGGGGDRSAWPTPPPRLLPLLVSEAWRCDRAPAVDARWCADEGRTRACARASSLLIAETRCAGGLALYGLLHSRECTRFSARYRCQPTASFTATVVFPPGRPLARPSPVAAYLYPIYSFAACFRSHVSMGGPATGRPLP